MRNLKITLISLLALMISPGIMAQDNVSLLAMNKDSDSEPEIHSMEMVPPAFMGGQEALQNFILENLKYPELAIRQGLEGTVQVIFRITPEGEIKDATIKSSCKPILDEAALDLIRKMPNWYPAEMGGETVETFYQLPIRFNLH
ncbi:TonB [Indibacter alkaliphilus LW1]|uniref:TonB n=1 Tax=Indibacter alkaliphilus (strain CCUG 57479 / KCTC 22604 / LW1) TaxID=1189612 RepID=S2CXI6_INDAL|nr:energy transducer TonB [Indibacter alkaliphilus]EOZ91299.1 TonB [Indibacter alkaliphilus LW1]